MTKNNKSSGVAQLVTRVELFLQLKMNGNASDFHAGNSLAYLRKRARFTVWYKLYAAVLISNGTRHRPTNLDGSPRRENFRQPHLIP